MRVYPIHRGVWGRSGSGKSTYIKNLLRQVNCFVVFDILDEYGGVAPIKCTSINEVLKAISAKWKTGFKIRYVPVNGVDLIEALDALVMLLMDIQEPYQRGLDNRNLTLVVDELAACAPNIRNPKSAFNALCMRGRHYGIGIIGASQRMADVTMAFRGNTTEDVFFPLRSGIDFETAAKLIGKSYINELKSISIHSALLYKNGVVQKIHNPPLR